MLRLLSFVSSTGKEEPEENVTTFRPLFTSITCILQDNFDLFFDIISFQHALHFDVGRSEIESNMKFKMGILVFTYGQKCHKTP